MVGVVLVFVLRAGAFDGCEITAPYGGIDRRIECEEASVSVTVDHPADAAKAMMNDLRRHVGDAGTREAELTVGDKKLSAYEYREKGMTGYFVSLPAGDRVRLAECIESKSGGCVRLIKALTSGLPPPTTTTSKQPLQFGETALTVPRTCRSEGPAKIVCAGTALTWSHYEPDDKGVFDVSVQALEAGFGRLGTVTRSKLPCAVAGVRTTCALLTITKPDGKALYTVFGVGKTDRAQLAVQCNTTKAPTSELGAPCDQAISLKAE